MSATLGTGDLPSRLVVTIYANSRPHSPRPDPPSTTPSSTPLSPTQPTSSTITPLLQTIIPHSPPNPSPPPLNLLKESYLTPHITQLTYTLPPSPNLTNLRHHPTLKTYETTHNVSLILDHPPPPPSPRFNLALFDMDSTLIDQEIIDELARSVGLTAQVSAITARAMNGEIGFESSLRERVGMLKGVRESVWEELKGRVTVAEGAKELVGVLRGRGCMTGVVSGGFAPMAEWLGGELGLDFVVANHLETSPADEEFPYPHLSGTLSPAHPIITPEYKRATLLRLANEHNIPLSQTLAVGDGSNDLLMLHAAGLGLAWNAKESVQRRAPNRLNGRGLGDVGWLCGD